MPSRDIMIPGPLGDVVGRDADTPGKHRLHSAATGNVPAHFYFLLPPKQTRSLLLMWHLVVYSLHLSLSA